MKFWIDMTNSPHVLFFEPVIRELEEKGHSVLITARDFASTIDLLNNKNIEFKLIGKHGGKSRLSKIVQMINRQIRLFIYLKNKNIDKAIGHASYDSAVVAKWLKITSITTFDYEYADTIHNVLLKNVKYCVIPQFIPKDRLLKFGIKKENIHYFNGLKEYIYLKDFKPDSSKVEEYIDNDKINIFIRPPAEMSEYYRNVKVNVIYQICDYLKMNKSDKLNIIISPRTIEQKNFFLENYSNFNIITKAFDGPQLMYWSDYVFSAGGTMIREAAALGSTSISITDLKIGAVDQHLVDIGRLKIVESIDDFLKINLEKKVNFEKTIDDLVFNEYITFILNLI